jgi:capsular exopolysaccharide synthesis family protein
MHDEPRPESISVAAFLGALRRRWYVVAVCAIVAAAVAYVLSEEDEQLYRSSATILFVDTDESSRIGAVTSGPRTADPEREVATILSQLRLPVIQRRTAEAINTPQGRVAGYVDVNKGDAGDSFIVAAETPRPEFSATLANAYAREFVDYRVERHREPLDSTRRELEKQVQATAGNTDPQVIARRNAQLDRIAELRTLSRLQDGDVELAQRASAGTAVEDDQNRNALIGLAVGLIIGSLLAMLFDTFDRRIRSVGSVDSLFGQPLLGTIPRSRSVAVKSGGKMRPGDREAFQMLRANLRYANDNEKPRSVVVTSSGIGEGKTTVAWNLAVAAAEAGDRVLLIEADLRQPVLAKRSGVDVHNGLADVLAGTTTVGDAIEHIEIGTNGKMPVRGIDVLFAGAAVGNPVDVLESEAMAGIVRNVQQEYDLVVVDTPPLTVVPDAMPVIKQVTGVIVVSRVGKTTSGAANRLREQLEHVGAKTLGVVANSVPMSGAYDYGYGSAGHYAQT